MLGIKNHLNHAALKIMVAIKISFENSDRKDIISPYCVS